MTRLTHLSMLAIAGLALGLGGCAGSGSGGETASAERSGDTVAIEAETQFQDRVARSALRERAIVELSQAALSDSALLRAHALEGMSGAPRRAETVARAALEDVNPGVRSVAAMIIGRLELESSATLAMGLLDDRDARVRAAAIYATRNNGLAVDPSPLASMLASRDPMVQRQAALVLGELGEDSATPLLEEALQRPVVTNSTQDRLLRLEVANALAKLGRVSALQHLRSALHFRDREAIEAAVLAARFLGQLNDRDSAAQLVELVEYGVPNTDDYAKLTDPNHEYIYPPELRLAAAQALADMGFRDGLYVADTYRAHPSDSVRAQAALLFGTIGSVTCLSRLDTMLADESELVRVSAASSIVKAVR